MADWAPKRFWKQASVSALETGFTVLLDARPLRTPSKAALVVPTRAMAEALAAEWDAQDGKINPEVMPITRSANSAVDKLGAQHALVAEMLAAYGGTDLLCYRAERPQALVARQATHWDPLLEWVAETLAAPLVVTAGVLPVAQPEASLSRLAAEVHRLDAFRLAAFHDLVALSGSLVLALAVTQKRLTASEAWELSRLDENWQIEEWGADEEADKAAAIKREAFLHADRFWALCG